MAAAALTTNINAQVAYIACVYESVFVDFDQYIMCFI